MPQLKPIRGSLLKKPDSSPAGRMVDSLIAYYLLNEGSGRKVFGLSGGGNIGTLEGTAPLWKAGKYGNMVDLPGTNEYILLPNDFLFKNLPFTLIITSSCVAGSGYDGFCDIRDDSDSFFTAFFNDTYNGLTWQLRHGAVDVTYYQPVVAFDKSQLNTYAFVSDGSAITFYLNGIETPTELGLETAVGGVTSKIRVGNARGIYGDVEVSYVQIYNQALSTSEITLLNREPFCMVDEKENKPRIFSVVAVGALTGTVDAQSAISGSLEVTKKITGTVDAQSTVSGDLEVTKKITGTVNAQSTVSGSLEVAKKITGTVNAQSTVSGSLEVAKKITGTVNAQSTVSGSLEVAKKITGSLTAQSNITGDLTVTGGGAVPLTGIVDAQSNISGDIEVAKKITGAIAAQSNASGILSVKKNLTGIITATSGVSADLTTFVFLSGTIITNSTVSSPGLEVLKNLTGQIQASGSVAGNILVIKLLTGSVLATSNIIGELSGSGIAEAEIDLPDDWMWIADMINEDGRDMLITVPGGPIDSNEPWRGNTPGTPVSAKGIFVRHTSKEKIQDHVKRQEQHLLIAPAINITISEGTKIVDSIDNSDWYVKDFQKITEETDILVYILQVRQ